LAATDRKTVLMAVAKCPLEISQGQFSIGLKSLLGILMAFHETPAMTTGGE
jgi:hypothetical protein